MDVHTIEANVRVRRHRGRRRPDKDQPVVGPDLFLLICIFFFDRVCVVCSNPLCVVAPLLVVAPACLALPAPSPPGVFSSPGDLQKPQKKEGHPIFRLLIRTVLIILA